MLSDYKRSEGGLDWHESWRFVNFPLSIYKKTKIPFTCQTLWRSLKWNYLRDSMIYSSSGKRRALVPPSVGYTSENLKPIPDEVCGFCSIPLLKPGHKFTFYISLLWDWHMNNLYLSFVLVLFSFGFQFGPRRALLSHAKEPLIFEVQLLKVLWFTKVETFCSLWNL